MKLLTRFVATFAIAVTTMSMFAETASAQFPKFNRRLFGTVPAENLARLEVVQKDLGLSDHLAVLTEDQQKTFQKTKGEKLEVDLDKLPAFGE